MVVTMLQQALLAAFPDGGQRRARRNARTATDAGRLARRERLRAYAAVAGHPSTGVPVRGPERLRRVAAE